MHPYKRRRLDAKSTLTRPFRSPLPSGPRQAGQSLPAKHAGLENGSGPRSGLPNPLVGNANDIDYLPVEMESSVVLNQQPEKAPEVQQQQQHFEPPRGGSTGFRVTNRSSSTRPAHDPEYLSLQKQHSRLALELKHISTSLDTTTQALKILNSNSDNDLERLIQKWRDISCEAAEELFSVAKDRVNRMGGVGVWRDKYQRQRHHHNNNNHDYPSDQFISMTSTDHNPWGMEASQDFDEDDLTEDQREQLEIARDEARREMEKYGLPEPSVTTLEKDEDSFTIDMMLKQLNVDLDVIGYDTQAQRWI